MSTVLADPILEALVNDFGGNYAFALDLLEQYRQDRGSVEPSWREYFDRQLGVTPDPAPMPPAEIFVAETDIPAQAPIVTATVVNPMPAPAAGRGLVKADKSKALVVPAILPGDIAQPIRGGALR